jgi:hypothetical protein
MPRHRDRGHHRVGGRVDHRNGGRDNIRDIDVCPVRGDGDRLGFSPHRDRGHHRVGGRVDHRNSAGDKIRDIGEGRRRRRPGHHAEPHRQHGPECRKTRARAAPLPVRLLPFIKCTFPIIPALFSNPPVSASHCSHSGLPTRPRECAWKQTRRIFSRRAILCCKALVLPFLICPCLALVRAGQAGDKPACSTSTTSL